jgi:hypothetical protein
VEGKLRLVFATQIHGFTFEKSSTHHQIKITGERGVWGEGGDESDAKSTCYPGRNTLKE